MKNRTIRKGVEDHEGTCQEAVESEGWREEGKESSAPKCKIRGSGTFDRIPMTLFSGLNPLCT